MRSARSIPTCVPSKSASWPSVDLVGLFPNKKSRHRCTPTAVEDCDHTRLSSCSRCCYFYCWNKDFIVITIHFDVGTWTGNSVTRSHSRFFPQMEHFHHWDLPVATGASLPGANFTICKHPLFLSWYSISRSDWLWLFSKKHWNEQNKKIKKVFFFFLLQELILQLIIFWRAYLQEGRFAWSPTVAGENWRPECSPDWRE